MKVETINIPVDIQSVKQVAEAAFATTSDSSLEEWFSFDMMERHINDGYGICLKTVDEKDNIIGMLYAEQESPINGNESKEKWVIVIAAVDPSYKRRGIGTLLLNEIEDLTRKRYVRKLFVYTNKGDQEVVSFYKKNGFVEAGWIKDYQYGKNNSAIFLLKYL